MKRGSNLPGLAQLRWLHFISGRQRLVFLTSFAFPRLAETSQLEMLFYWVAKFSWGADALSLGFP